MSSFLELLVIYKYSLPATIIMATVLALVGAQWTARGKSEQIFVLGQGISLGVVLGLIINILMAKDFHELSLICGFFVGWLTLSLTEFLIQQRSTRGHVYLTLFVFFLALTYLLSAITPSLETHLAAAYFGDIAVMSDFAAKIIMVTGLIMGALVLKNWRKISLTSFQIINHSLIHRSWKNVLFELGTLFLTCLAVQNMGYLFSMGTLFIGTTFASSRSRDLKSYTQKVIFISSVGSLIGFSTSLLSTNFPTVPCVLLGQIVVGFLSYMKK
jgi:zinc/manganese transport system permease protein/iron/zinc/copper transport system permease protein